TVYNSSKYVGAIAATVGPESGGWSVTGSLNAVGPYAPFDEPGVELPAYGLVHLSAYVRRGPMALELGIRNLLDHTYPAIRAGGYVSPGLPRTIYTTLRYRWP
ncbi:MAG TPA: TonB-dependent receptor, partial [Gemmatimonadales bacterium]|nr:TonB-dependent receptor [Gemmatimonadales bacterium]